MPRNLIIPSKYGFSPERYKTDMQTLEQWARQPIQRLIAGSGITLSPASGLATDANGNGPNPITISASGGGGITHLTSQFLGITNPTGPTTDIETFETGFQCQCASPPFLNGGYTTEFIPSNGAIAMSIAIGPVLAVHNVSLGVNVVVFQLLEGTTTYSSGSIDLIEYQMYIVNAALTQQLYIAGPNSGPTFNLPSGLNLPVTDWATFDTVGAELSLGSDQTTHLVQSTSTTDPYWINIILTIQGSGPVEP